MKTLLLAVFISLVCIPAWSQKKSDFNFEIGDQKIENNVYGGLEYIESREEPEHIGAVFSRWNGMNEVTLSQPLGSQLQSLFNKNADETSTNKIAVQMRRFYFDAGYDNNAGKSTCNIRITLYQKDNENNYYFINTLDTLLVNGNKEIKKDASDAVTSFIIENLAYYADEAEPRLDLNQVMDIDIYEMAGTPFYNTDIIPDGVYKSYRSLMHLTPDIRVQVTAKKGDDNTLKDIQIPDPEKQGKYKKIKNKDAYAVVVSGKPFISFNGNFYEAYKKDGMWCFTISQKVAGSGFSLGIGVGGGNRHAGGGIGIGIPIGGKKEKIEMIIDHLNGEFYWGDKIIEQKEK